MAGTHDPCSPTSLVIHLVHVFLAAILMGCGAMHNMPGPEQPTAVQQFLMAQAVETGLRTEHFMSIPLAKGDTVSLETSGIMAEQRFLKGALAGWLGERGLHVRPESDEAKYRIHVLVEALGTEQSVSFFGVPAIQSGFLPIAVPEIALYKAQYQNGYTRFRMDFFETATGKFIRSTPWVQGSTYFNEYTVLMFIDFHQTDLISPL